VQKAAGQGASQRQLIDARADFASLGEIVRPREMKDVFAVESEVAQEIADSPPGETFTGRSHHARDCANKDTAAYDLFLKGEYEEAWQ